MLYSPNTWVRVELILCSCGKSLAKVCCICVVCSNPVVTLQTLFLGSPGRNQIWWFWLVSYRHDLTKGKTSSWLSALSLIWLIQKYLLSTHHIPQALLLVLEICGTETDKVFVGGRDKLMNKKRSDHEMTQSGGIKTMCGQKRLLPGSNFGTET